MRSATRSVRQIHGSSSFSSSGSSRPSGGSPSGNSVIATRCSREVAGPSVPTPTGELRTFNRRPSSSSGTGQAPALVTSSTNSSLALRAAPTEAPSGRPFSSGLKSIWRLSPAGSLAAAVRSVSRRRVSPSQCKIWPEPVASRKERRWSNPTARSPATRCPRGESTSTSVGERRAASRLSKRKGVDGVKASKVLAFPCLTSIAVASKATAACTIFSTQADSRGNGTSDR